MGVSSRQRFATRLTEVVEARCKPRNEAQSRGILPSKRLAILDRGKGGDSGEEVDAVVRWNDKRTSMWLLD